MWTTAFMGLAVATTMLILFENLRGIRGPIRRPLWIDVSVGIGTVVVVVVVVLRLFRIIPNQWMLWATVSPVPHRGTVSARHAPSLA